MRQGVGNGRRGRESERGGVKGGQAALGPGEAGQGRGGRRCEGSCYSEGPRRQGGEGRAGQVAGEGRREKLLKTQVRQRGWRQGVARGPGEARRERGRAWVGLGYRCGPECGVVSADCLSCSAQPAVGFCAPKHTHATLEQTTKAHLTFHNSYSALLVHDRL